MRLKNTFVQGKMNKDIDERLLPKGQYPHAENVRVANTDSSDMGAIENVMGNEQLTLFALTNAKTIGVFSDDSNQKLYWFTTSDEKDLVVEYDVVNSQTNILLESSRPNGVLNFERNHLITGVVKIINGDFNRDLLIWTDDINPPRMINIERSKTYGSDGFIEDDISLIKKPPRYAPEVNLTFTSSSLENNLENKFLSFAYRYKYLDGGYSAISSYSNYAFAPSEFNLDYQTMENEGMVNSFNAVNILFNTGDERVTDVELLYKETNSNALYVIERFNKEEMFLKEGWTDNSIQSFQFSNSKKYIPLSEDELFRAYDNVPRVAKALDIIGSRIVFGNYVEGYDLVDRFGENINLDYDVSVINKDLSGEQVPATVNGTSWTIDLSDVELVSGSRLNFEPDVSQSEITGSFSDGFDFILNSDYANAQELATDEDFIFFVESIMTNGFLQGLDVTVPDGSEISDNTGFQISSSTSTSITLTSPTTTYETYDFTDPNNPILLDTQLYQWSFSSSANTFFKEIAIDSSLKTDRSYEVGIIYMDKYGRATTVLTDADNTEYIDIQNSTFQNKLQVNINHNPPYWADRYKIVVKQNKGDYHTVYTNVFYQDGLFRWVKLEGANKDKVTEGDTLIVKSDLGGALQDLVKVRVLEVETKEKNFIEDNEDEDGNAIIEESGLYMKIKPVGFDMNGDVAQQRTFEGSTHLRYPTRTHTSPAFGEKDSNGTFIPFSLGAGSTVTIYINVKARGKIEFNQTYEKTFRVGADYDTVKDWFDAEVEDLGSFGRDYTWNGEDDIGSNICGGGGLADDNNRFSGWGFDNGSCQETSVIGDELPNSFYVVPFRKGTSSRNITTTVKFEIRFSEGTVIFETESEDDDSNTFFETEQTFDIIDNLHTANISNQTSLSPATVEVDFFNCYVQGNGAESYRFKDAFNTNSLNIDLRPSSTSVEEYREVRRYADLTYSEVYNENNNQNGINEFNLAKANFKEDIDKKYGYIQKLYSRDTDILVFQEDKVSKVLYGKDLLMNADGTSNVSSIEDVLGQQIAFRGEYGISRNPESFAFDGYHIYFTDAKRGAVMRLGNNGLEEISNNGMRQFFKDEFRDSIDNEKVGAFDPYQDQYVLHPSLETTVEPINIPCSGSVIKSDFAGEFILDIDYGLNIGEAGFNYNITTDNTINLVVTWDDGTVYSDMVSGLGVVTFDKTKAVPSVARVQLIADDCTDFEIMGNCVESEELTVISVILNDPRDEGLTMKSRYRWQSGEYVSPFKNFNNVFGSGEVDTYDILTGSEGSGGIPITGSTIYLESFSGSNQSASFSGCNSLGYLMSNTLYGQNVLEDLANNSVLPVVDTVTSASGDESNSITFDFNRSNGEKYLYLIWNYIDNKPVVEDDYISTEKGTTVTYDVRVNDSSVSGEPLGNPVIVSQPINGTVTVNSNGSITYAHNDNDATSDSFSYIVSDDGCPSDIATVYIDIAVSCDGSFNYSGNSVPLEVEVSFGTALGTCGINYEAYSIPDQFEIFYDGQLVATTGGLVSGSADLTFEKTSPTPTTATIRVTPNSSSSTAWNFSGICP